MLGSSAPAFRMQANMTDRTNIASVHRERPARGREPPSRHRKAARPVGRAASLHEIASLFGSEAVGVPVRLRDR